MEQSDKKYRRKPDITLRSVAGAHLLLPSDGTDLSVYTLNSTGLQLWELIEQPRNFTDLVSTLKNRYSDQSVASIRRDVRQFLDDMVKRKLADEV